MSLKVIRNEISAVQQELLLKLEIKSIAMLEYTFKHFQPCGKDQIDHTYLNPAECAGNPAQTEKLIKEQRDLPHTLTVRSDSEALLQRFVLAQR